MAFNFNWSPLIADTDRVRDMLTTALNKSPKPPIIVDDILVNELNLGSTPPELEILEIGDFGRGQVQGNLQDELYRRCVFDAEDASTSKSFEYIPVDKAVVHESTAAGGE